MNNSTKLKEHIIQVKLSPLELNALNNYVLSKIGSRQGLVREMILECLEKDGFPTEMSEKVRLRDRDYTGLNKKN